MGLWVVEGLVGPPGAVGTVGIVWPDTVGIGFETVGALIPGVVVSSLKLNLAVATVGIGCTETVGITLGTVGILG